jgi:hypothetical protein
MGMQD